MERKILITSKTINGNRSRYFFDTKDKRSYTKPLNNYEYYKKLNIEYDKIKSLDDDNEVKYIFKIESKSFNLAYKRFIDDYLEVWSSIQYNREEILEFLQNSYIIDDKMKMFSVKKENMADVKNEVIKKIKTDKKLQKLSEEESIKIRNSILLSFKEMSKINDNYKSFNIYSNADTYIKRINELILETFRLNKKVA